MAKKIIGWVLVIGGVLAIICGLWQSYQIFTDKMPAPAIFKISEQEQTAVKAQAKTNDEMVSQQIQQLLQDQLGKMIPIDTVAKLLNLTCWSIFVGILTLAAGKIAGIGVSLLKNDMKCRPERDLSS